MAHDIDQIIAQVKHRVPSVQVEQLKVRYPGADDDGLWFFNLPETQGHIQIESPYGQCPFIVEHTGMKSSSEAQTARSIEEAVEKIVSYLNDK